MGFLDKNAPLRLLRKAWANPDELAQELYAMFSARGPGAEVEVEAPVTIRAQPGRTALRIVRDDDGPAPATANAGVTFGSPGRARRPPSAPPSAAVGPSPGPVPDDRPRRPPPTGPAGGGVRPAVTTEEARVPAPLARRPPDPPDVPAVDVEGPIRFRGDRPVYFDRAPFVYRDDTFRWEQVPVNPVPYPAGGGGTTTYVGTVVSGSGRDYRVQLLASGARGGPGPAAPVAVTCPAVAEEEQIPPGTLLAPIFQFADAAGTAFYEGYPPVWIGGPTP